MKHGKVLWLPLVAGAFAFAIALLAPGGKAWSATPTITVEELGKLIDAENKKGSRLKGYGLSVFEGTKIEKFEVEFRQILWNMMGKRHMIWTKVKDLGGKKILERANVVQGMSGSPIYVKVGGVDRLVGALSFGYGLSKMPLAGVTPIQYMLEDGGRPLEHPKKLWASAGPGPEGMKWIGTPLFMSGFAPGAVKMLKAKFKGTSLVPMVGGGGSGKWTQKYKHVKLEPGSAVAIPLVSGDFDVSASGTITWTDGKKFLAFGHQFLGGGESSYPVSTAYVQGVVPLITTSFKMAAPIREVGAMSQDRTAAIGGLLGKKAKTFRVKYTVRNLKQEKIAKKLKKVLKPQVYNVKIVNDGYYGPYMLMVMQYSILSFHEPGSGDNTVYVKLKAKFKGYDPIVITDAYYSEGEAFSRSLFAPVYTVMFNRIKKVELESVEVELAIDHEMKLGFIKKAETPVKKARAGRPIDVKVTLGAFGKKDFVRNLKVLIPKDLKPGRHSILIAGGSSLARQTDRDMYFGDGVRTVEDMIAMLNERARGDSIVALFRYPTMGIRLKGKVYPNVPDSIRWALQANEKLKVGGAVQTAKQVFPDDWTVIGGHVISIEVVK